MTGTGYSVAQSPIAAPACRVLRWPTTRLHRSLALFGSRYNYNVLGIVIILTVNYSIKQNQFTNQLQNSRVSDLEESNEVFERAIR